MEEDILEGHYLLKNHRKVRVISSSNGHYPISGGRKLMNKIISYKPDFVLVEEHPQYKNDIVGPRYTKKIKTVATKSDVDWALLGAEKTKAIPVFFDLPVELFHEKIYNTYLDFSKDMAITHYISYQILNILWHYREKNKSFAWQKIFSQAKSSILKYGPKEAKVYVSNNPLSKSFSCWLKTVSCSKKDLQTLPISYLHGLRYFMFLFALSGQRDRYMIKIIQQYAAKGKVLVVVGAGHLRIWLKKGWMKEI